jgi:hypothetical protein
MLDGSRIISVLRPLGQPRLQYYWKENRMMKKKGFRAFSIGPDQLQCNADLQNLLYQSAPFYVQNRAAKGRKIYNCLLTACREQLLPEDCSIVL